MAYKNCAKFLGHPVGGGNIGKVGGQINIVNEAALAISLCTRLRQGPGGIKQCYEPSVRPSVCLSVCLAMVTTDSPT